VNLYALFIMRLLMKKQKKQKIVLSPTDQIHAITLIMSKKEPTRKPATSKTVQPKAVKKLELPVYKGKNCYAAKWGFVKSCIRTLYSNRCMKCKEKGLTHVDHIKPASIRPELFYDIRNLQILCAHCNISKKNKNSIDYRKKKQIKSCDELFKKEAAQIFENLMKLEKLGID
jgi:5-methylcytosine-specific restriction endonuclease McrA